MSRCFYEASAPRLLLLGSSPVRIVLDSKTLPRVDVQSKPMLALFPTFGQFPLALDTRPGGCMNDFVVVRPQVGDGCAVCGLFSPPPISASLTRTDRRHDARPCCPVSPPQARARRAALAAAAATATAAAAVHDGDGDGRGGQRADVRVRPWLRRPRPRR